MVAAENASATIRPIEISIAMPPKLKMITRLQNCRREIWRFRMKKNGNMKTRLDLLARGIILMRLQMILAPTDGKKTANVGELMHWFGADKDLLLTNVE